MNLRNPHPQDALVKRARIQTIKQESMTPEQLQELQDQKQAAHGAAVAKMLHAKETKEKREKAILRRGQPQVADEMAEAVNARMNPADIPTIGNTNR